MDPLMLDIIQDRHTKEVLLRMELHFCNAFFTANEVSELIYQLQNKLTFMQSGQPEPIGRTYHPTISTSQNR